MAWFMVSALAIPPGRRLIHTKDCQFPDNAWVHMSHRDNCLICAVPFDASQARAKRRKLALQHFVADALIRISTPQNWTI